MWSLLAVISVISLTSASRILGIIPSPSYSHQVNYRQIWREMSQKGHQVTVLTTDPMNDPELTNLTEIDLHHSYKVLEDAYALIQNSNPLNIVPLFLKKTIEISEQQLADERVRKLTRNESLYDVVIVEVFFTEFLAFAELYGCPKILISSMDTTNFLHSSMGNPAHPIVNPEYTLPFSGELSFVERLISTMYNLFITYYRQFVGNPQKNLVIRKYFGDTVPSVEDMVSDVDMMFLNLNPVLNDIRPYGPATITFGGGVHMAPLKPLPKDLKQYVDAASEGFIYLSFGSNIKTRDLGQDKIKMILEVLKEIPYKVIWKFELDDLPGKPDNVKLMKWVPQQDILRHPNIKLFITQGGLQSIDESISSHVPMVVLPFFGDQAKNARIIERKGIAKIVDHKSSLKKEEFKKAILEVIQDGKYKKRVEEIARLILDQPMTGVEKVIWWTEYVIRNNGAKHLRSPLADVPLYQFVFLDVAAFVFLILIATAAAVIAVFKLSKKFLWKVKTTLLSKKKKL